MRKISIVIALIIWVITSYIYSKNFSLLETINNKLTDVAFYIEGEKKPSDRIVIVDFDEKSLSKMHGFSRKKLAKVIDNLNRAKVSIIGLNIAFPRADITSPKFVLSNLGLDAQNVEDYDEILANSFKKSAIISGYIFDFSSSNIKGKIPNIPSVIIERNYNNIDYLPTAKGIISNIQRLQVSSLSSGYFNMISDKDGVTRSLPLIVKYKGTLYPSLPLELVREIWNKKNIVVDYSDAGVNSIFLDDYEIPTDRFGRLIIKYKGTSKSYRYISAYKIYADDFNASNLKDKIVLLSASTSRFRDLRAIPLDSTFESVEILANVIDNILNTDFLYRPNWIELFDIFLLSVIFVLLVIYSRYGAIKNTLFFILLMSGFLLFSYLLFIYFGLLLNILLPVVASFILYSLLTSLNYINEVNSKAKLNQKLILEMKNRHDIVEAEVAQKTQELQKVVEEKTVLLRELHHRVKNNLQLILSISRLQQHEIKDEKLDIEFSKLQNRISSIAKTHEILCDNDDISNVDMSEYIGELCEEMESSFVKDTININVDVNATLPLRQAVYVGLVINEILSNSVKHAFDEGGGEIHIYLAKIKSEYVLRISDDGKGCDENLLRDSSLGLKLVDALVVNQLEGSIKVQLDNKFGYIIKFKAGNE